MDKITSATPSPALPTPARKPVETTAREFEGVLVGQMLKAMMATLGEETPGGAGEEMFRGVLAEKIGTQIAAGRGIGLSASVVDAMLKTQGEGR